MLTNLEANPSTSAPSTPTAYRFSYVDLWLFLLMIVWGSNITLLKATLASMPPFVLNGVRFTVATIMLYMILKAQGVKVALPRREWLPIILLALTGQALYQGVWLTSLKLTTVANNSLLLVTVPVWVILINIALGHERLSRRAMLGVVLALLGVGIVITRQEGVALSSSYLLGDALSLVAALIWAITLVASRKPIERNPSLPTSFWLVAWGAISQTLLGVPDALTMDWSKVSGEVWIAVLYSGLISIGLGNMIWNYAIKRIGTNRPAIYTYLEPAIAASTAVLFLNEPISGGLILGGGFVLVGVLLARKG